MYLGQVGFSEILNYLLPWLFLLLLNFYIMQFIYAYDIYLLCLYVFLITIYNFHRPETFAEIQITSCYLLFTVGWANDFVHVAWINSGWQGIRKNHFYWITVFYKIQNVFLFFSFDHNTLSKKKSKHAIIPNKLSCKG